MATEGSTATADPVDDLAILRDSRPEHIANEAHVKEIIGIIGDYEYARGHNFILRRELGLRGDIWCVFCGVDAWLEEERDLTDRLDEQNEEILREQKASETRVLDESAAEHIRNAQQILVFSGLESEHGGLITFNIDDLKAASMRLGKAVDLLENGATGAVTTDDSPEIAALVDELDMNPHLFMARYVALERRVVDLERLARRTLP